MPANDQLNALDATFLELEQADDSALMHIGALRELATRARDSSRTLTPRALQHRLSTRAQQPNDRQ